MADTPRASKATVTVVFHLVDDDREGGTATDWKRFLNEPLKLMQSHLEGTTSVGVSFHFEKVELSA